MGISFASGALRRWGRRAALVATLGLAARIVEATAGEVQAADLFVAATKARQVIQSSEAA